MPKVIGICRYCHEEKKLCDAHIIPRSFLGKRRFLKLSTENRFIDRSPKGPYDRGILCADCDRKIGVYDGYAKELLLARLSHFSLRNGLLCIPQKEFDYLQLKKFFISVLWRASISKHEAFSIVSLGEYEKIALDILHERREVTDNLFDLLLFKDAPSLNYKNTLGVFPLMLAGKEAYSFRFSHFQATIILDSALANWSPGVATNFLRACFLRHGNDFLIPELFDDLTGMKELLEKYVKTL